MARSIRIEYPGAFYHVMARGNRRELIFLDDDDRRFFLRTLSEACERTGWRVHAWVLMGNHYHLFLETPEPNLSAGMKWLQNTFTRRFNIRHRKWGRVFGDRYKAVLVEGRSGTHFLTLMDYIHLNPVRARLIRPEKEQSVLDFPWSSVAGGYALAPGRRAPWLNAEAGLAAAGETDTVAGRRRFVERLDRRAVLEERVRCGIPVIEEEVDARCSHLRRGWYWGTQAFAEEVLRAVRPRESKAKSRAYQRAPERRAHGLQEAKELLKTGLDAAGLTDRDLPALKSTYLRKVALAELLWRRTTVSQVWLAETLHLRSAANVSQILRRSAPVLLKKRRDLPAALVSFLQTSARKAR
jgi:putative transposase